MEELDKLFYSGASLDLEQLVRLRKAELERRLRNEMLEDESIKKMCKLRSGHYNLDGEVTEEDR